MHKELKSKNLSESKDLCECYIGNLVENYSENQIRNNIDHIKLEDKNKCRVLLIDSDKELLINVTQDCLMVAIEHAIPGNRIGVEPVSPSTVRSSPSVAGRPVVGFGRGTRVAQGSKALHFLG